MRAERDGPASVTLVDRRSWRAGRGEHPALVLDDGSTMSYGELSAAHRRDRARARGRGPGPRPARGAGRREQRRHGGGAAGSDAAGAWAVPLNARMSAGEIDAICAHCEPRLVYFASAIVRRGRGPCPAPRRRDALPTLRAGTGATAGARRRHLATATHDVAVMIYTSGSTGTPKGVMLTHANLGFVTEASLQQEVLLPDDVIFHALPISHSFGLVRRCCAGCVPAPRCTWSARFSAPALAEAISSGDDHGVPGRAGDVRAAARMVPAAGPQADAQPPAHGLHRRLADRRHAQGAGRGAARGAPAPRLRPDRVRAGRHAHVRASAAARHDRRLADSGRRGRGAGREAGPCRPASTARSASAGRT